MQAWNFIAILALVWALVPMFAFGFAGTQVLRSCEKIAPLWCVLLPAVFGMPYLLVTGRSARGDWLVLYLGLPILIAALLWSARRADPQQLGNWRDFAILLLLGLAVDLR